MRILYAEDNDANYELVARILAHDGHDVVHAHDGATAIEEARRDPPALVLMDLGLPDMDGWETSRRIRGIPGLASVPVVALSGSARRADRARAEAEGFAGFIEKPFRLEKFRADIRRFLEKSQRP